MSHRATEPREPQEGPASLLQLTIWDKQHKAGEPPSGQEGQVPSDHRRSLRGARRSSHLRDTLDQVVNDTEWCVPSVPHSLAHSLPGEARGTSAGCRTTARFRQSGSAGSCEAIALGLGVFFLSLSLNAIPSCIYAVGLDLRVEATSVLTCAPVVQSVPHTRPFNCRPVR